MKKQILIPLVILGILLLAAAALAGLVYVEIRKMSSVETQEVVPGLYVIKDGYVNFYLIQAQAGYIAVDAGVDPDRISLELSRLNIDPAKVSAIFLTHSDVDHTAGLSIFPMAKIYLPKAEEQMINGQTRRFLFSRNTLSLPHDLLEDNQDINIAGIKVKVILTPGHTPGSTCFLVNDTYLFTGDSLALDRGEVREFSDLFNMDTRTQRISLNKLSAFSHASHIFTAHHGWTDQVDKAFAKWKD